jgi:hypothetical protein
MSNNRCFMYCFILVTAIIAEYRSLQPVSASFSLFYLFYALAVDYR